MRASLVEMVDDGQVGIDDLLQTLEDRQCPITSILDFTARNIGERTFSESSM